MTCAGAARSPAAPVWRTPTLTPTARERSVGSGGGAAGAERSGPGQRRAKAPERSVREGGETPGSQSSLEVGGTSRVRGQRSSTLRTDWTWPLLRRGPGQCGKAGPRTWEWPVPFRRSEVTAWAEQQTLKSVKAAWGRRQSPTGKKGRGGLLAERRAVRGSGKPSTSLNPTWQERSAGGNSLAGLLVAQEGSPSR